MRTYESVIRFVFQKSFLRPRAEFSLSAYLEAKIRKFRWRLDLEIFLHLKIAFVVNVRENTEFRGVNGDFFLKIVLSV